MYMKKIVAILLLSYTAIATAQNDPCANENTAMAVAQCDSEKLKTAEAALDEIYQNSLKDLPDTKTYPWDRRKTKDQLEKSQSSWFIYRNENCNYLGGLQGNNSTYITIFSTECSIKETKSRIDFFMNLPTGG